MRGSRRLCQVEHRRNDVGELNDVGDAPSRAKPGRLFHDERHADVFVVQKQPVLLLPVVAESFPVIRHEDDRGLVVELMLLEIPEKPPERLVDVCDLPVVWRCPVDLFGGLIRR